MINLGVRAHDFGKKSVIELSENISRLGFTSIQLALKKAVMGIDNDYGKLSPGMGNYIRDSFRKSNINISILGCYINPVHPDPEKRGVELNRFIEHLKYSRSFGCSVVGTETGSPLPNCGFTEDIYLEETFQDFLGSLRILVEEAEKLGVIVGIEAVADKHCIHSHERVKRVLDLIPSPNLGLIYDPVNLLANSRINESDILMKEAFELFSHRMVAVHAKDYIIENGVKNGTIPSGKGLLNYELLFDLIKHYKPFIDVLLENNNMDTIETTTTFIRSIKGYK